MKKSHRKEVIIARIIFAAILLVLIGLIVFAASFISKKFGDKDDKDSQTKIESQVSQGSEESQQTDSEETQGNQSTHTPGTQGEDSEIETTENSEAENSESENLGSESSEAENSGSENSESQSSESEEQPSTSEEQPAESESQDSEPQGEESYVWVTSVNVKFRTAPNTTSEVIIGLNQGTVVQMVSVENGWAKVIYDGHTGYIRADLLKKKSVTNTAGDAITSGETGTDENVNASQGGTATGSNTSSQSGTTAGKVVVIDPGHQRKGDSTKEANGPGSSTMKARVTGGTTGWTTGVPEYELTLEIGLMLKTELESRGYTAYMTRSTHDVNISNKERAQYATTVNADIAVRLHGNGVENTSVSGALTLSPSSSNPYISDLAESSMKLSKCVLSAYCNATGMKNKGCQTSDTMTGINWSTVPVTILEMGYMTNSSDDTNMQDDAYQKKMVQGIADGIDDYFGR